MPNGEGKGMNVHIVHDGKGGIIAVHRTVDGLAHVLMGHGDRPVVKGDDAFSIERLSAALDADPVIHVGFADAPDVVVERHAVLV